VATLAAGALAQQRRAIGRQRRHREDVPSRQLQLLPAGGQYDQPVTGGEHQPAAAVT
jgi:hypothetical protein